MIMSNAVSTEPSMTTFGPFRLDTANQRLYCGSAETQLSYRATAILEILIRRANQIVTHEDLLNSVWPDVHVQPEVLKVYIAELRKAMRDSAENPRYIQTVHRRGYRLIAVANEPRPVQLRRDRSEHFVGRDTELANLSRLLRKASGGQRQIVFVTGEAGIGKTTLLRTFLRRAERRPGVRAAFGQVAHARGETEPFSAIVNALGELLTAPRAEPLVSAFLQYAPGWLLQFPSLVEPEEIARVGNQLAGSTSQRMIREFAEAINRCCSDGLMILALDDLHRADPSTFDLLEFVASMPEPANLLIIAAADCDSSPHAVRSLIAMLESRRLCEEVKLEAFSRETVLRFLEERYPQSEVGNALAERLHRLSGGIPLFLYSAVHYMEAQAWILKTEDGWITTTEALRLEELVPPVLKDLIELEIRQLSPEEQQILEAASIVGPEFFSYLVAHALEQPVALVEEACNRIVRGGDWLESAGFEEIESGAVSASFRFLHVLSREVLYCRQAQAQRVRRHRRVALALEKALAHRSHRSASELAVHFTAGKERSKAVEYLRAAAATASHRYAGAEAAALLSEALTLAKSLPSAARTRSELEILNELGAAYFASGDFSNCAHAWHEAASKAMRHGRADVAIHAVSRLAFPVGWDKPVLLRASVNRILSQVCNIEDPVARAEVTIRLLALRDISGGWTAGDYASANDSMKEILRDGDPIRIATARIPYAWFQIRSSAYEDAIAYLEESLTVVLQHDPVDVARAEWALGWALLHAGHWGRMQSVVTAAAAHAKKNGSRRVEALFTMQLAWLHVECGDYESARNLCQQAFEASGEPTSGVGVVLCHVIAAMAAIGLHNADMTLEFARRARSANTQTDPLGHALAEISALQAHVMKHNLTDIRHSMHRLAQLSANLREQTWKAIALAACAEAAVETGELKLARQYSAAAMQLVEGAKLPLAQWRVEAAAAEIAEKSHSTRAADMDAAQLREKSKRSRQELYNSLGVQDPLRQFAKTEAPALQVMTALGES